MSVIRIMTNFNIELEFPAASFGRRLLAWALDIIFVIIILYAGLKLEKNLTHGFDTPVTYIINLLLLLVLVTYHLVCEITMNGQSFGKKLTRVRVVNENGGQPGIGQFVIRWLIRSSDWVACWVMLVLLFFPGDSLNLIWQIGVPVGLFITDVVLVNVSKKNQRLGDMLAHTLVISSTEKHSITDTIFQHIATDYVPSFPQVMQLSDRDINSLKRILDTARSRRDDHLALMASNKIRNHLNIQTGLEPIPFMEVLLKDYNYLSAN